MEIELTKEIRINAESCEPETWYWIKKDGSVQKGFTDEGLANKYYNSFVELLKKHNGIVPPEEVMLSETI